MKILNKIKNIASAVVVGAALYCSQGYAQEEPTIEINPPEEIEVKIESDSAEEFALKLAKYAKGAKESVYEAMDSLDYRIKQGKITPDDAKEIKEELKKGIDDYLKYENLQSKLGHNNSTKFRYDVDVSGPVMKLEIVHNETGERAPYPKAYIKDLEAILDVYEMDHRTTGDSSYVKNRLLLGIGYMQKIIDSGETATIDPSRYLPLIGQNEHIDEFVNKNLFADFFEIMLGLSIFPILFAFGHVYRKKTTIPPNNKAPAPVDPPKKPEPPKEVKPTTTDPWEIDIEKVK